ncbi:hypothetical protein [Streptomyces peucetius]|uniref:Uncharacterized protein n=1 Tax=Streptomyces peucetius TaxID=1950 RepID=A0ABY6HZG7_STRPE|nr:hypothetical protein [Streptomyces peucetius]UYQ60104.1 hypothetical protein OGH68_00455 [Streptomyces peucetius]
MTVFYCAKCGAELTPDLRELQSIPDISVRDRDRHGKTRLAPSTVPRGSYAIDPEPWGAPFVAPGTQAPSALVSRALLMPPGMTDMTPAGPRNSVIVHPEDTLNLQLASSLGIHHGCCGPLGTGGPNMTCVCRARVATLAADCMGPHELHLDPLRTYAFTPDTSL